MTLHMYNTVCLFVLIFVVENEKLHVKFRTIVSNLALCTFESGNPGSSLDSKNVLNHLVLILHQDAFCYVTGSTDIQACDARCWLSG